jgi:hypothetical protein
LGVENHFSIILKGYKVIVKEQGANSTAEKVKISIQNN